MSPTDRPAPGPPLASYLELFEVVRLVTARLSQVELDGAEDRLSAILGLLGVQLGADRVWAARVDGTRDGASWMGSWSRDVWLPPAAPPLDDVDAQGSTLWVRSAAHGKPHAVLAVHHRAPDHPWAPHWVPPLRIVADSLAQVGRRLASERELAETTQRLRMLSAASQEGLCLHRDGWVVEVNDALVRMVRADREHLVGSWVLDWIHPEDRPDAEARFREGRAALEVCRVVRADGSMFWCEVSSRHTVTPDGHLRALALRDITEAREAEVRLRESEERFRILGESTYDGIAVWDGYRIVQANPSFARMFGHPPDRVVGLTPDDLHPTESVDRLLDRTESGGHDAVEVVGIRADGSRFPVLVRGRWCRMDGGMVRISGYLDLTAREQAERDRRALEAQVRHAQKLESLGLMAGGIAHDFNNLLVGVLGNAELALMDPVLPSGVVGALERIRSAAQRASQLTKQMLAYSGKGRFEVRRIDVNERIRDIGQLLRVTLSKGVWLRLALADDLWAVDGDPGQIDQILLNLVTNAGDAIGDRRGVVQVTTYNRQLDGDGPRDVLGAPLRRGRYVVLEVSDTGGGMPADVVPRIFEPFYTTKFTGRGLGLAAVQGIVRGHEGAIDVESEVGKGTLFRVWLPASAGAADPLDVTPEIQAVPSGRARVLVADDEPAVRDVARRLLERAGFDVQVVGDGMEALSLVRAAPQNVDVVLLDLTMPGPSGYETLALLREVRSDLPIVLCSGYALPIRLEQPNVTFLQKPFRVRDLVRALEGALER